MGSEGFIAPERIAVALSLFAAVVTSAVVAAERGDAACTKLASSSQAKVSIELSVAVPGGEFTAPDGQRLPVAAFCRVRGAARPTADSNIVFELWMPAHGWNGRYYQLGSGGFAGSIHYPSLAAELKRGNAVAVTDTGHRGDRFDASWALGQPQKIIDYGYRSLQQTADAAKALIRAYYGESSRYNYFTGCSNGGRQALMLAQRYPQDWNGILAGAPAYRWTQQLASFASVQHALRARPENWISPSKLPTIQRAALASCTADARVFEDVPTDPRFCRFDPAKLICAGEETDQCLTSAQAKVLSQIVEGFDATAAAIPGNWEQWIVNVDANASSQRTLGEQFFRNMVFDDREWKLAGFDPGRDLARLQNRKIAGEPLAHVLDATSPDLGAFDRRGGKLLMYFGWADALISPQAGVDYYERVIERMGGLSRTQSFYRLFMVPGMTHCQGGPGANAFGQSYITPGLHDDAEHDVRRALEAWVEQGRVPQSIVATKYVSDDPVRGVGMTRRLCAFPAVSKYRGDDKANEERNRGRHEYC